jgi:hypothetical protein
MVVRLEVLRQINVSGCIGRQCFSLLTHSVYILKVVLDLRKKLVKLK